MNNLIHTELLKLSKEQKDRKTQKTKRAFWKNPRIWRKYFNKIFLTDWLIFEVNSFELCWLSCTKLSYFQFIEWFGWHRQKQPPEMFYKKRILVSQSFAKFTGKHLCQSLFFNKVAVWGLQLYWKRDSGTGAFLWTPFYETPLDEWFYCHRVYIILILNWRFIFLTLKNLVFQNFAN